MNEQTEGMSPVEHWGNEYGTDGPRWSGRVNATTADVVGGFAAGDVLELGCGEGGDAVWLAEGGWQVTAVDISPTAIARGAEAATARGVDDRITWIAHDLATWDTTETFDLVTASFFHSMVDLPRAEILRKAAVRVRVGGRLVVISHVFENDDDIPPWSHHHHEDHHGAEHGGAPKVWLTPEEEIAALALDADQWEVEVAEVRPREATGPDGQQRAMVKDGVVVLQRR